MDRGVKAGHGPERRHEKIRHARVLEFRIDALRVGRGAFDAGERQHLAQRARQHEEEYGGRLTEKRDPIDLAKPRCWEKKQICISLGAVATTQPWRSNAAVDSPIE